LKLVRRLTADRPTKLLIFANSRKECERIVGAVSADAGLQAGVFAHYSSLSPDVRVAVEKRFAESRTAICVATSTLELGIDVGDIDAVLLWSPPSNVESFLQRIGRSNRRSKKVNVICIIPDDSTSPLRDALVFASLVHAGRCGQIPLRSPFELFGSVAQQCASIIASDGGRFTRVADLSNMFGNHDYLDRSKIEAILSSMETAGCVKRHGFKNQYGADELLYSLVDLKMIYGNFPQGAQTIELFHMSKCLGSVPTSNLLKVRQGAVVRFAGRKWAIRKIGKDRIEVEPDGTRRTAIDFTYAGELAGIAPDVANKVWVVLHSGETSATLFTSEIRRLVSAKASAIARVCSLNCVPFHRASDGIHYYTFAGRIVNKAIGLKLGKAGAVAKDFVLITQSAVDWTLVPTDPEAYSDVFTLLFEATADQSYYQKVLPEELQIQEFLQPWLKEESIRAILQRLAASTALSVTPDLLTEFD
jgi:ATP-dependent Lhr-like helicase